MHIKTRTLRRNRHEFVGYGSNAKVRRWQWLARFQPGAGEGRLRIDRSEGWIVWSVEQ
jgi:hypothetical protein